MIAELEKFFEKNKARERMKKNVNLFHVPIKVSRWL